MKKIPFYKLNTFQLSFIPIGMGFLIWAIPALFGYWNSAEPNPIFAFSILFLWGLSGVIIVVRSESPRLKMPGLLTVCLGIFISLAFWGVALAILIYSD